MIVAFVFLVGGCGGSPEADVRETVETYFAALSKRDFPTACARVSPTFQSELGRFAEKTFPDLEATDCVSIAGAISATRDARIVTLQSRVRVSSVEVDGEQATARLGTGQVATLEQIDGEWLIAELDFSGATGTSP